MRTTRLAPSPTGALHLGNARTFLVNWLMARRNGWHIILRIEDLDGPRIKAGADRQAIEDLQWMGIDWDTGPIYQSHRRPIYAAAMNKLLEQGDAFWCVCTRRDVEAATSAPHAEDGSAIYPGTCRDRQDEVRALVATGRPAALRFKHVPGIVRFNDAFAGEKSYDVGREIGDFVIGKGDALPAYQLAVVVDDAAMGVSDVVRGDDLLDSTARQMLLYEHLKLGHVPHYYHLPLIVGPDGRRLAKRHGDSRLSAYRESGWSAGDILKVLARWCGIDSPPSTLTSAKDLLPLFDVNAIPRGPIVVNPGEDPALRLESRRE